MYLKLIDIIFNLLIQSKVMFTFLSTHNIYFYVSNFKGRLERVLADSEKDNMTQAPLITIISSSGLLYCPPSEIFSTFTKGSIIFLISNL